MEGTMRYSAFAVALAVTLGFAAAPALAQSWRPPSDGQRCPSKWGPNDERGSGNHMKPESVLRATQLIKTGEVIELAYVLSGSIPVFGTRRFDVPTQRTFLNQPANPRRSNAEH